MILLSFIHIFGVHSNHISFCNMRSTKVTVGLRSNPINYYFPITIYIGKLTRHSLNRVVALRQIYIKYCWCNNNRCAIRVCLSSKMFCCYTT